MSEFLDLFRNNKKELIGRCIPPLLLSAVMFFLLSLCRRFYENATLDILFKVVGVLQFVLVAFVFYLFIAYSSEEKAKKIAQMKEHFNQNRNLNQL